MLHKILASTLAIALFPAVAAADPCSDAVGMYAAMGEATAYSETKVEPGGPTIKTDFVAPDRWRTITGTHEVIQIGRRMWSKFFGRWLETSGDAPKSMIGSWKAAAENGKMMQDCRTADVMDLGMVDGAHGISIDLKKFGVRNVLYLRPDLLPVKIETTTRGKTYVTTYADWNAPSTIEAP